MGDNMSSTKIDINFEAADRISNGINELHSTATSISSSAKGIDASPFSSYSGRTVSAISEFATKVNEVADSIDDLASSFNRSVDLYREALKEIEAEVKEKVENPEPMTKTANSNTEVIQTDNNNQVENTVEKTEEKPKEETKAPETVITNNNETVIYQTIEETMKQEIESTISFYFNYPKASKKMVKLSSDKLAELLVKNGATKVNDKYSIYKITIDGKSYEYNTVSGEVKVYGEGGYKTKCRFYASSDTDFSQITNTITFMGGSGKRTEPPSEALNMSINKNSLVILPVCDSPLRATNKIGGCTRIGDFMAGGKNKNITNSVSGYSLGGIASFAAVADNPGLYQKIVTVNAGAYYSNNGGKFIDNNPSAFKDVEIIMLEGSGDKFVPAATKTIQQLHKYGISMENISIYTNDTKFINSAKQYLPKNNIHVIPSEFANSHKGWSAHSYGYQMLEDLNVFSYLSA